eukprot:g688.t1
MVDYSRFDCIGDDEPEDRPQGVRVTRVAHGSTAGLEGVGEAKKSVTCDFLQDSFDLKISGLNGKSFQLSRCLYGYIVPAKSKVIFKPNRLTLKLKKAETGHWGRLEGSTKELSVSLTSLSTEQEEPSASQRRCKLAIQCTNPSCAPVFPAFGSVLANAVWVNGDRQSIFDDLGRGMDAEEWEDKTDLDWTLEDLPQDWATCCKHPPAVANQRCVRITLLKKPPVARVVQWWSRVFERPGRDGSGIGSGSGSGLILDETDIDVTAIRERNRPAAAGKQGFKLQSAWSEAQEEFRRRVPLLAERRAVVNQLLQGSEVTGEKGAGSEGGMEEARCCAILDEAIEELLTQVAKKEVKLQDWQDQRIRRDQKKKVDVERLPDAPGESRAGCSELMEDALRWQAIWHREENVWQGRREQLLEDKVRLKDKEIARERGR